MLLLRIIGLLGVIAIGACTLAYALTRDRRYLDFAWRLAKWLVGAVLAVFALLALERLAVLV